MDGKCYIRLQDLNLYYPSTVFNSTTLKQVVFEKFRKGEKRKKPLEDVHALQGISLELHEGDRLGVIGLNGAGKSTLLKAMAGLYPIRSGTMEVHGEIRAMLELSLGFDILSTGRENIMYRGLMLGLTPDEVHACEQDIVDFAGLGEFIDYPINSYSSGMMVRLAFSILTTVSGEILLVDEVLSAGDAGFQEKARKRMLSAMDRAKILVLVLHDMSSIKQICNRVIMLEHGQVIMDGSPDEVTEYYLSRV